MEKIKYSVASHNFPGDMHTPVSLYLKLRDIYTQSALLECTDYLTSQNSKSIIALDPIASIKVVDGDVIISTVDGVEQRRKIEPSFTLAQSVEYFMSLFDIDGSVNIYGYSAFDCVKYLEPIDVKSAMLDENDAPDIYYILFRYTLHFDHYHNTLTLNELVEPGGASSMKSILSAIECRNFASYSFKRVGEPYGTMGEQDYRDMVTKGIGHCQGGDVFQIVLSRRFIQKYKGDDFTVYRKLRRINPSPYLFYFDFGAIRIFGSSPETHCRIEGGRAYIDPIAGTAFRSGDSVKDAELAQALLADPKENAEHVMLVDLARNDLSRNCDDIKLEHYKQIQYYSHVIHLVSRVSGAVKEGRSSIATFFDTFPAGTLSGAPKVKAMQLISSYEPHSRGIYGGAIGYIGFDGSVNHAITIRTFVSRNGALEFQAGAGVVIDSNPERELQETNSKLGALSTAVSEDINS